jgi:hypothetical protein
MNAINAINAIKILIVGIMVIVNSYSAIRWQTTRNGFSSGGCQIQSNKIRVNVHPFFVDVEEEAEISPVGDVWSGDAKTLEIVNEFDLSHATAIQSMLLWNGERILKAKLKMKSDASGQYEDVVDRQKVIVAPRDPAIIEYVNEDLYRCRIYPVEINSSRKIRIRYVVPISFENAIAQFNVGTIFTAGSYGQLKQVQLSVEKVDGYSGKCILTTNNVHKSITYSSVYLLSPSEMVGSINWQSNVYAQFSIIPEVSTLNRAWTAHVSSGAAAGYYSIILMAIPGAVAELMDKQLNPSGVQLEMGISIGKTIYLAEVQSGSFEALYCKSDSLWDGTLFWNGYNTKGDQVFNYKQIITPEISGASTGMVPMLWGQKYTFHEKRGTLGAIYGFVDSRMSLLALESDTLASEVAEAYSEHGVPQLLPEEVIVDQKKLPATPKESVIFEIGGTGVMASVNPHEKIFDITGNGLELRIVTSDIDSELRVKLLDLSGRVIQQWFPGKFSGNVLSVKMNKRYSGTFIVQIQHGARLLQKKVVLR